MNVNVRRLITVVSCGLSLLVVAGAAGQEEGAVINADGSSGTSNAGLNPAVDADGPTIVYGDLYPGPGTTVIGPPEGESAPIYIPGTTGEITASDGDAATLGPGDASAAPGTVTSGGRSGTSLLGPDGTYSVSENTPSNVSVGDSGAAAPAPVADTTEYVEPVAADTAPVSAADSDGDNYVDAQELEVGLDPTNPDSDGDGVADGDEVTIYGTDPYTWDSDGDGIADGDELFNTRTDPLVWNGDGAAGTNGGDQAAAGTETLAAEGAASGTDSDNDRLADADEAALGTDPAAPDTDGDGYYDGDEANLGTDPFDPGSFPAT
jgi:hypothetical protein